MPSAFLQDNVGGRVAANCHHPEGFSRLAQVAQGDCAVSILVGIQKLSGHGPGQPTLEGPA